MKNIKYLLAPLAFVLALAAFAFTDHQARTNQLEVTNEDGTVVQYDFAGGSGAKSYQKTIARDTISAATTTTTDIPWIMASPYQYNYYVRLRKIGVTPNVKVVLQEANTSGSTLWYGIDSFSCSGADSVKVNFLLRGTTVYGAKHRLRFVKTGTGAVQRDILLNIKPTN